MAVSIQVDKPDIDIRVRTYDGYVEVTGIAAPLVVGDAQVVKGDLVDAGPATTGLVVGDAGTTKGDTVEGGASTALVAGDATTQKGNAVAADGTSAQAVVGDAETDKGEATQGGGVNAPLAVGGVQMEGPWNPPWMPQDRPLSDFTAANLGYDIEPHFYLNFDEPHAVPKRLKDNWQRGTEATYWDGSQLRTAAPNEPRVQVDPETGERYLLAEPQRKNEIVGSDEFEGVSRRYCEVVFDKDNDEVPRLRQESNVAKAVFDCESRNVLLNRLTQIGSGIICVATIWARGEDSSSWNVDGSGQIFDRQFIEKEGEWGFCYIIFENDGASYVHINTGTGATYLTCPQITVGTFPTSYIPTPSGSTATRAPDDLSDLSFSMEGGAKSVYFRIKQEASAYAPNEGGSVTNAEVNLTDSPGTAGGGLLRPSTGILGISADGWIDAVVNSTDEDLQGNSTSDVVDGLTIQPDKDPSTDGAIYRIHELVAWEEERSYDERRNLTSERPQPWQELDAPNISTLDNLNGDIDWSTLGISEPPHLNIDIPRFGIPAKMRSAWERSTVGTYWDENGVLQTAAAGEPRLARSYDGSSWNVDGVLAEPQRTNEFPDPRTFSPSSSTWNGDANITVTDNAEVGIDGAASAALIEDDGGGGTLDTERMRVIPTGNFGVTTTVYVKKGTGTARFDMWLIRGSENKFLDRPLDLSDGSYPDGSTGEFEVEDAKDFWRVKMTMNHNDTDEDIRFQITPPVGGQVVVDAFQVEIHHRVATDANGYADATHATMPILTGGATRSEDRLVMPIWWPQGIVSGGYIEAYQQAGGDFNPGGRSAHSFSFAGVSTTKNSGAGFTAYDIGLGTRYSDNTAYANFGWAGSFGKIAANNDDAHNPEEVDYLWLVPNDDTSNIEDVKFILRRLYMWPQELTEGTGGQLKALFDHDFSV